MIHRFVLQKGERFEQNGEHNYALAFVAYLFFNLTTVCGLIMVSSFDGFETKKNLTIVLSAVFAFMTLAYSFYFQFDRVTDGDDSVIVVFAYQFSLRKIMANAQRVVGLFLVKQTYSLIKSKEKATSIYIKPKLNWIAPQVSTRDIGDKSVGGAGQSVDAFHNLEVRNHVKFNKLALPNTNT